MGGLCDPHIGCVPNHVCAQPSTVVLNKQGHILHGSTLLNSEVNFRRWTPFSSIMAPLFRLSEEVVSLLQLLNVP